MILQWPKKVVSPNHDELVLTHLVHHNLVTASWSSHNSDFDFEHFFYYFSYVQRLLAHPVVFQPNLRMLGDMDIAQMWLAVKHSCWAKLVERSLGLGQRVMISWLTYIYFSLYDRNCTLKVDFVENIVSVRWSMFKASEKSATCI